MRFKEGWINLYRSQLEDFVIPSQVYQTEKSALTGRVEECYIDTVKIEWMEETENEIPI